MTLFLIVGFMCALAVLIACILYWPIHLRPKAPTFTIRIERYTPTPREAAKEERMEYKRWKTLADPAINRLRSSFLSLTRVTSRSGLPAEAVSADVAECIDLWYAYLDTQDGIGTWVHAYDYLESHFGPGFEKCLTDSERLKERLRTAALLQQMGTVRIEAVEKELLQLISGRRPVRRCDLAKMPFSDQSPDRIRAVISELVRTGRVKQFKNGSYYYITSK